MGKQVTVKVDSRVFYGLVAVVAVLGIFAIGWYLGTQLNGEDATTAQAPAAQQQPAAQTGAGELDVTGGQPGTTVQQVPPGGPSGLQQGQPQQPPQQAVTGGAPVSVEEVPVGENEPRIWIEGLAETDWTHDFGQIPADQPTEKDFTVTNIGTGELVIEDASASCGCTAALVEDDTLGPGESTTIRASYDPRVNQEFGKFVQKQVRIKSNDPVVPLAEFTLTADVATQ